MRLFYLGHTPQSYSSYVTEYECEHYWQDPATGCIKLFKLSCFSHKNLYKACLSLQMKNEKILKFAFDYRGLWLRSSYLNGPNILQNNFFLRMTEKLNDFL